MADNNQSFSGCGVIVTGAGSGIGQATALQFASAGANVFATDINADGVAETASLGSSASGTIHTGVHDISSRAACYEVITAAKDALGDFSVLCNVAGISWAEHATEITEEMWDKMIAVNLSSVFWLSQAALPHLLPQAGTPDYEKGENPGDDGSIGPSIINVASNAGLRGQAFTIPYCAAKGGVVLLTRSFAMEFVKTGLRVNAVAPGGISSALSMNFQMPTGETDFSLMQPYIGFRGMGQPGDIADAILFLASNQARRIHGAILSVDAGLTSG